MNIILLNVIMYAYTALMDIDISMKIQIYWREYGSSWIFTMSLSNAKIASVVKTTYPGPFA